MREALTSQQWEARRWVSRDGLDTPYSPRNLADYMKRSPSPAESRKFASAAMERAAVVLAEAAANPSPRNRARADAVCRSVLAVLE